MKKILLMTCILMLCTNAFSMVDPSASTATVAVYSELQNAQGKYMYVGVQGSGGDTEIITDGYSPYVDEQVYDFQYPLTNQELYLAQLNDYRTMGGFVGVQIVTMPNLSPSAVYTFPVDSYRNRSGTPCNDVLAGQPGNAEFNRLLDEVAVFVGSSQNNNPVLFRPFNEMDGFWFWWCAYSSTYPTSCPATVCPDASFISMWQYMVTYLRDTKGLHNLIYVWSPDWGMTSPASNRYPGDDYVDIVAADKYENTDDLTALFSAYSTAYDFAVTHNKVFAISEGVRDNRTYYRSDYWTWYFAQLLAHPKASRAAYILFWNSPVWGPDSARGDASDFNTAMQNNYLRLIRKPYGTGNKFNGISQLKGVTVK